MKKILLAACSVGLSMTLFCCTESPKPASPAPNTPVNGAEGQKGIAAAPTAATFKGIIRIGDEQRKFVDCATGKTYWLDDKTGQLVKKAAAATEPIHWDGEASFGTLSGKLMGKAKGGHAAECDDVLAVEKVDSVAGISAENFCLPFNFICHGTEPFWNLIISEGLQAIVLEDIAEGKARVFPWTEPEKQKNGSYLCTSTDAAGNKIRILVKPEKTGDGMADTVFDHSVLVAIGKKTWKGVAVKG